MAVHSTTYKPKIIPIFSDNGPDEIDRLQDLSATTTLNREKIEEIARDGIVGYRKTTPTTTVTLGQLEYGSIEFWRKLANKGDTVVTIPFTDFRTSAVDIVGFQTDDKDVFIGTVWYPMLRLSGFGINIGDPNALIDRSFTLVGENEITYQNDTKYLIHKRLVVPAGSDSTVTLSSPTPAVDPDSSGQYIQRVVRMRSGVGTELNYGTDWSYDGAGTLTINGVSNSGDVVKVWYAAATDPNSQSTFTLNDSDLAGITADSADIFLVTTNRVTRLQSISLDGTLSRNDYKEIGNKNIVIRAARDISCNVTFGRILEDYTVEEILRGKAGQNYDKIDLSKLSDELSVVIKVYSDDTKNTFKLGYKLIDLAPTTLDAKTTVNDYETRTVSMVAESGFVTSVETVL